MEIRILHLASAIAVLACVSTAQALDFATPVSEGNTTQQPIKRIPPVYPRMALNRGTEGWVLVEFIVEPDGKISNVNVVSSEPPRIFDRAATVAVKKWRYGKSNVESFENSRTERVVLTFEVEDDRPKLSKKFKAILNEAEEAIGNGELDKAKVLIESLPKNGSSTSLGQFYKSHMSSKIALAENNIHLAIFELHQAIQNAKYLLTDEALSNLYRTLFALEVKGGNLTAAIKTSDEIILIQPLQPEDPILVTRRILFNTLDSQSPIKLERRIPYKCLQCGAPEPQWRHQLYRNLVMVENFSSKFEKLEVSCANYWAIYDFSDPILVSIKPGASDCQVLIRGDEGTTFEVIELWADR